MSLNSLTKLNPKRLDNNVCKITKLIVHYAQKKDRTKTKLKRA